MTLVQLDEKDIRDRSHFISTRFPLINAVAAGKQQGKIFALGDSFFLLHKAGFSFLNVQNDYFDFSKFLQFLMQTKEIPQYFHVYDPPEPLLDECEKNDFLNIKIRSRIQLKFTDENFSDEFSALPVNHHIEKISENNFECISVFDLKVSTKFWHSKEDFLNNGFGFFLYNDQHQPVSVCYAACITNNTAEIDVATLEPFQRMGLAKATVAAFVKHCIINRITPNWDCFEENYGSLKTAETLGFNRSYAYRLLSVFKKVKEL